MEIASQMKKLIDLAIKEDVGTGDITTENFIDKNKKYKAKIVVKEPCVICGVYIAKYIFETLSSKNKVKIFKKDGDLVKKGEKIIEIIGDRSILTAERLSLNFLQQLSAIATKTYKFSRIVEKYGIKIYDTRKTIPNFRIFQKYAVKVGGGFNHRVGLYEHFMIKDNHLSALKYDTEKLSLIINEMRKKYKNKKIEIEVQNLYELEKILKLKPDIIMLDNMKISEIKKAVEIIKNFSKKIEIEISGGVNEKNIKKYLNSKVDRISIGALTHSIKSIDISLEIEEA